MDTTTRLFQLYAKNLRLHRPNSVNVIICPLCLKEFSSAAIKEKRISKEHIIPESLGGRLLTLTCTECNNTHGTDLDAHLVQRIRMDDAFQGSSESPVRATVQVGEGEQTVDMFISNDKPEIRLMGLPELSNPDLHEKFISELEAGRAVDIKVHANLQYNTLRSDVAMFRAAYLLMFSHFGYGYVLHESVSLVRKLFSDPGSVGEMVHGLLMLDPSTPRNTVGLVQEPKALQSFIAVLDLSTETERPVGVVLPGLGSNESSIYQRWTRQAKQGGSNLDLSISFCEYSPDFLVKPEHKDRARLIWKSRGR